MSTKSLFELAILSELVGEELARKIFSDSEQEQKIKFDPINPMHTLDFLHLAIQVLKDDELFEDSKVAILEVINNCIGAPNMAPILDLFEGEDDEEDEQGVKDEDEDANFTTHLDAYIKQMEECDCSPQPFYRVKGHGTNPERIKAAAEEQVKKAVDKFLAGIMGDLK